MEKMINKMTKRLLMEHRDYIYMAVMDKYEGSEQLVLGIGKGLA
jgi:hypothetical protein